MLLSEHFTAEELGIEKCDTRVRNNAEYLCQQFLEKIREHFNSPVVVKSGYRGDGNHNAAVGGKATSYHLYTGDKAAGDIEVKGVDNIIIFDWLRLESKLPFDKVILEYATKDHTKPPRCVHLQVAIYSKPRRQAFIGETGACEHYEEVAVV